MMQLKNSMVNYDDDSLFLNLTSKPKVPQETEKPPDYSEGSPKRK